MTRNTWNTLARPTLACGALLAVVAGSTIATPVVKQTWTGKSGPAVGSNGQGDERQVVQVRVADAKNQHSFSKTIYDVDDDGERTSIEVTSENGHTVVKLNGHVVNEFDNDAWGKFEVKNSAGDVIAHVIQVPGGSVVVRPGDAMSAFNAIGGIQVDLEAMGNDLLKDLRFGPNSISGNIGIELPKAMLGINMDDLSHEEALVFGVDAGTRVTNVLGGSPAAIAGLHDGDVIVQIDSRAVDSAGIRDIVRDADPGRVIRVKVKRDGDLVEVPVELKAFDPAVMGVTGVRSGNWIGNMGQAGDRFFGIGNGGPIQIEELKQKLAEMGGGPNGPGGILRLLDEDNMQETREHIAKLAQELESEAQRMAIETGAAKQDVEKRLVELAQELSARSGEMARMSAEGALRGLRFFGGPGQHGLAFGFGDDDEPNLFEFKTQDGKTIVAQPPVPPVTGADDARYQALMQRYEAERAARRAAEARLQEMNERLQRLEDRLGQLLEKLDNR
ncbi:MAG: PDZ domain-containing protein [Phycisphaerales bacterium]|nr:PDZ domain-containing protein [Phycisphaerales bacterium]